MNTLASHLAFAPFFVFSLAYSAVAYVTALGKEVLNETTLDTTRNCKEQFRIFIDVGHYRSSPGATSARGKVEFDFNLRLAQTLQQTLVSRGYRQVKLFVSAGGTQSLQGRTRESAKFKADILISIHHDDVQSRELRCSARTGRNPRTECHGRWRPGATACRRRYLGP